MDKSPKLSQYRGMAGYTKLFNSILASTIWRAKNETRLVWITLLAMAGKHGIAEGSIPGLADLARVSIEDCEAALEELAAPDKYSRTTEHEGRRIEKVDGGWLILNHAKYRERMSADERREYFRLNKAKNRAKHKEMSTSLSTNVKDSQRHSTKSTQSESETQSEKRNTRVTLTDEEWLASLKADPAYTGIDIDREIAKMKRWCSENNATPTRRRFVNWLNKADKPLTPSAPPTSEWTHQYTKP